MKDAAKAMNRVKGSKTSKQKAFNKILTDIVFVLPRKIPLQYEGAEQGKVGTCQRPFRASTAMGERIALANSETVPEGTVFEFTILLLESEYESFVLELLEYSQYKGFLQWRNSGKGRAMIEVADE